MDKKTQMCELFYMSYESREMKKRPKTNLVSLVFVSSQKGTSLDEGPFMVEHWMWEKH